MYYNYEATFRQMRARRIQIEALIKIFISSAFSIFAEDLV